VIRLNLDDIKQILFGCALLGTGGGGDLQEGVKMVEEVNAEVNMISLEELNEGDLVACPYFVGSVSPRDMIEKKKISRKITSPVLESLNILEEFMGKKISGVFPTELGGGNTAVAFQVAAMKNIPVVNADPVGRAVPEVQHTTFFLYDIPMTPFSLCNEFGDKIIVPEISCDEQAEEIIRSVAVASENRIGVTSHPLDAKILKKSIVANTLSKAWKIAKVREAALIKGEDPVAAVAKSAGGYVLFKGVALKDANWRDEDGFTVGDMYIEGVEKYKGRIMKIWFKNENLISWIDDIPYVTSPDLIILVHSEDASPVLNPHLKRKDKVSVIGIPSEPVWRSPRAIEILGPRHFGFDIDFIPVERRIKSAI
jgi:hypothetical protein